MVYCFQMKKMYYCDMFKNNKSRFQAALIVLITLASATGDKDFHRCEYAPIRRRQFA
jgi:hypothetical protein